MEPEVISEKFLRKVPTSFTSDFQSLFVNNNPNYNADISADYPNCIFRAKKGRGKNDVNDVNDVSGRRIAPNTSFFPFLGVLRLPMSSSALLGDGG